MEYKTFVPWIINQADTLRKAGERIGLYIGCATSPGGIRKHSQRIKRHYSGIVAEVHQNMSYQQPERERLDFRQGDYMNEWRGDMDMRGHVLAWYWDAFIPDWLKSDPGATEEVWRDRVKQNINRYPFRVWSTGNEIYNEKGAEVESIWQNIPGYPYRLFEIAREETPLSVGVELNSMIWWPAAESNIELTFVQTLAKAGLISHYGLQLHDILRNDNSLDRLEAHLRSILEMCGDIGIKAEITEWDIRLPVGEDGKASDTDLARQAYQYGRCMEMFAQYCKWGVIDAVYFWGSHDAASWIPYFFPGYGAALPLGAEWERKPAYGSLLKALM